MAKNTGIQWAGDTVNPIMGCGGCELYPKPAQILNKIDRALMRHCIDGWERGQARLKFEELVAEAWEQLLALIGEPGIGHINDVTT